MVLVFRVKEIKKIFNILRLCQENRANGNGSIPRQDSGEKSTADRFSSGRAQYGIPTKTC